MFLSRIFSRQDVPSIRRPQPRCRPGVEFLEGRQLQSGIIGNPIGVTAASTVSMKVATPTPDGIVGNHIG